jgi:DNA-binding NarL/FixJ family response regulator
MAGAAVQLSGACPACGVVRSAESDVLAHDAHHATVPRSIAEAMLLACKLSPRERMIFEFLGLGYDNRSIARTLEISERTTKRHVTAILAKLELESRLQAGLAALLLAAGSPAGGRLAQRSHGLAPGQA